MKALRLNGASLAIGIALAGCAAGNDDSLSNTEGAATVRPTNDAPTPAGLAEQLHDGGLRHLEQFLDTRGDRGPASLPTLTPVRPRGGKGESHLVTFPFALATSAEMKTVAAFSNRALDRGLQLVEAAPQFEAGQPRLVPGIYFGEKKPVWPAFYAKYQESLGPSEFARLARVDEEATVQVVIVEPLPGPDGKSPHAQELSFGIVERPLSREAGAPVGKYWTLLAIDLASPVWFGE